MVARRASETLEGKWGIRADQMQEMKGKEGSGDPEGQEAKRGLATSGPGLDTSGAQGFFADVAEHQTQSGCTERRGPGADSVRTDSAK